MSPSEALTLIQGQKVQDFVFWPGRWIWIGRKVAWGPGSKIVVVSAQAGLQHSWSGLLLVGCVSIDWSG